MLDDDEDDDIPFPSVDLKVLSAPTTPTTASRASSRVSSSASDTREGGAERIASGPLTATTDEIESWAPVFHSAMCAVLQSTGKRAGQTLVELDSFLPQGTGTPRPSTPGAEPSFTTDSRSSVSEGLPKPKWSFMFNAVAGSAFQKAAYGKKKGSSVTNVIRVRFNSPETAQLLVDRQELLHGLSTHMACEYLREALPQVQGSSRLASFSSALNWTPNLPDSADRQYLARALQAVIFVVLMAGERGVDEAVLTAVLPRDLQTTPAPPWRRLLTEVQPDVFGSIEPERDPFLLEPGRVCVRKGVPSLLLKNMVTEYGLEALGSSLAALFSPQ
jgi:hypothetical protein